MDVLLDHEKFEGAKILAEIGTKIAAGRAELANLDETKEDFINGREADAISRVNRVLEQSKELLAECTKYQNELVGYRNELSVFLEQILCLIQRVEAWKAEFDKEIGEKNQEIDKKIKENDELLAQIRGQRALLAGESEGIKTKRANLAADMVKIKDEWATLGRAKKELGNN